ncbi:MULTISPECIES: threonine--tRNA ligase [unclassified Marinobacterium]|jgi:threonyl-tRNA synthetase|uniref:threonine--tRNA ligase n=1 Tax=unclassified Marinobacterium TaxID=2644139 RepID=UPI0015685A00|nr:MULTISPECIES: threonine--tRNA ligase [unclassified Marinobacterium]NRP16306.1 Threonine--tRNA ligase [Marinobacterium sp. xm-a-152]NRP27090.1 Threonine--tRNA ligase [Marinobacterium sp. xm-d-420]NRP36529.1 Threonine--tRNA ligase [Marinobacterium sp. xm-d-579]NRP48030.1 Threonine--tRNA ligase [Marinobacterium sp. xm-d-543]NRP52176.1 Threonine--tRNA ligase [Marinobacterium sp. xm-v-242]
MPVITLPDSSKREFDQPLSVFDLASDIGPGLAKATLAGRVNGELVDTSFVIEADADVSLITARDEEGVDIIRHSTAHLMAMAVQDLFPGAQVTIGPTIDDGFYYDFAYERPFTPEDLEKIEKRMAELAKSNLPVERSVMSRPDAVKMFEAMGEKYKVEIIESIPGEEDLSFYKQGDFIDLCRGPHVPNTGHLKVFKLMKVAGAYWRGDVKNEQLTRIYGTAWGDKKDLKAYLHRLEEAEKRDHRKLGKQLNLFHLQEEAPGMVFWHPNGWTLWQAVEQYMREQQRKRGYQEIKTPQVVERTLWEKSGHWDKFQEQMFTTHSESRDFAVKPMNCPCHIQVFNQGLRSYRDLPLRMAEFGSCHRNEPSGALHGIMRVRGFVQDDGHTFCAEDSIQSEVAEFIDFLHEVYTDFGFSDIIYKLSTRPEQRVGSDEVWDKAEKALADALDAAGLDWEELPGEGAFYGPKIEFSLRDCLGRVWQCGTIQVDFSMPGRLDAQFVNEKGDRETPVMLHRAILGSFERFIGILIEHYAGALPTWLSPVQVAVMNITDKQSDFVNEVVSKLQNSGIRAISDLRNEKIGFKIRERTLQKIPYLLVIGDKEVESGSVAVRTRTGEDMGVFSVEDFANLLIQENNRKGRSE